VTGDESEDAFSGQTVPLDVEESEKVAKSVVANSRKQYAKPKVEVEKQMEKLFSENASDEKPTPAKKEETPKTAAPARMHDV
jgi:hypothetical protein